jgi:hypothetical protein
MKTLSKCILGMLCMLWFDTVDATPVAGFSAAPAAPETSIGPEIRVTQNKTWVQFFERNRRRNGGNQRRQNRQRRNNNNVIPLRTGPGGKQLRMRELRPQERNHNKRQEQDTAREAVRRGDILPLGGIIESAQSRCPGKFLGAKLQRGRGGYSYRVRILRPSGRRVGLTVDAKTGAVVGGGCR